MLMPTSSSNSLLVEQPIIAIKQLSKRYGSNTVLDNITLSIGAGEIVGLIGPNGAGKSTLLKAIMGLIKCSGDVFVFGKHPYKHRAQLLENMSYIADVAALPSWMKVRDVLSFLKGIHPKFSDTRAGELLKDTSIEMGQKIETLSKGMKTRLHLAIVLSIDTNLLILDEPTLGLDVLVRREFQDRLVKEYANQQRSILVTTHQIDEIASILTRVIFINEGKMTVDLRTADIKQRYSKLITQKHIVIAPTLQPIYQRLLPEHVELIFDGVDIADLQQYGDVVTPSLEDLFVAMNTSKHHEQ